MKAMLTLILKICLDPKAAPIKRISLICAQYADQSCPPRCCDEPRRYRRTEPALGPVAITAGYRTLHGAQVGDLFMSLIHTCYLNGVNSFEYLVELLRHAAEVAVSPREWMPWIYRTTRGPG